MPIDLNRDEFLRLPRMQREAVVFDNLQDIKTSMKYYQNCKNKTKTQITIGAIWLFILTVAIGLKKFLPI